jgi:hypothetical protein
MAVTRKTFIWKGGDRAVRDHQSKTNHGWTNDYHGSTGCHAYNALHGQHWVLQSTGVTGASAGFVAGTALHKQALDVFWNDADNWVERIEGTSGGGGGGNQSDPYFYQLANRIPHRGDHVIFAFVGGNTGNGLQRKYMGNTGEADGITGSYFPPGNSGNSGDISTGNGDTIINLPLSPCLFGGRSKTYDGLSGEGSIWVNADTSGTSAGNRSGPLTSVKVEPSYHTAQWSVKEGPFKGWADRRDDFNSGADYGWDRLGLRYWGGRVINNNGHGLSGASFGNVEWDVGSTGINIKALDVSIQAPYSMPNVNDGQYDLVGASAYGFYAHGSRPVIELNATDNHAYPESPWTQARLGYSEDIINLSLGCRTFLCYGGSVRNFNMSDRFMYNASDDLRKAVCDRYGSPGAPDIGQLDSYALKNTITTTLRCDPCWFKSILDTTTVSIGSPEIIWGPYYAYGMFHPNVTAPATITCYPQFMSSKNLTVDQVEAGAQSDDWDADSVNTWQQFGSFEIQGLNHDRFAATTINMKEFNPRWDVIASQGAGGTNINDQGIRGFNNQLGIASGCTITNLNMDAGCFNISHGHPGGDTYDTASEVGDIVISGGYAEQKSYIIGVHPSIPAFNAFYIGVSGVGSTGYDFQIRSRKAEFDFGAGTYLRSGPQTTGVTGAIYTFTQAPIFGP